MSRHRPSGLVVASIVAVVLSFGAAPAPRRDRRCRRGFDLGRQHLRSVGRRFHHGSPHTKARPGARERGTDRGGSRARARADDGRRRPRLGMEQARPGGQRIDGGMVKSPVQILIDAIDIGAGHYSSFAVKVDGTVWGWGQNTTGQIGTATTALRVRTPKRIEGLGGVSIVDVAGGRNHVIALSDDGSVYAWGSNTYGQLGDGTWHNSSTPEPVSSLTDVVGIFAGRDHSRPCGATVRCGHGGTTGTANSATARASTATHRCVCCGRAEPRSRTSCRWVPARITRSPWRPMERSGHGDATTSGSLATERSRPAAERSRFRASRGSSRWPVVDRTRSP